MKTTSRAGRRRAATPVLLAVAAVMVSVAACTALDGGGESAGSCAFLRDYKGRTYGHVANVDYESGERLGTVTSPPCDDTPNDDDDAFVSSSTAYAVKGLDPSVAIAVGDTPDETLFLVVGSGRTLPPEVRKLIDGS
ncbi:DUF6281 family protein [Streptomyces griseus]|uniref:DUF6281 family protein n=1 Tax=Streptomyces griseus TaxID=1911 RepID=UPI00055D45DE|nr:DUF6281 family protein [Streptomyces griseus]